MFTSMFEPYQFSCLCRLKKKKMYVVLYERVRFPDICVCLCMCEWERIGPVSHLIVIASVFGLETVDRNQQSLVVVVGGLWRAASPTSQCLSCNASLH